MNHVQMYIHYRYRVEYLSNKLEDTNKGTWPYNINLYI